ncbi:hypothetical protein [Paenibacillus sp. 7541]|uniref:Uncharacterized protein n=2 Tax=Paenibacillus campinasensis TaxID=66347 RepID=A0A268EY85_9BACL|nr:hypothetical protein [Paenibacillus sp. 7541]PAD78034.1 hypothetical protein CHH67_08555 [Paenibacillus campinasensis]PAK52884.1 hypothetical protein CHH75_10660 [Paenibacillus sp. 7541]
MPVRFRKAGSYRRIMNFGLGQGALEHSSLAEWKWFFEVVEFVLFFCSKMTKWGKWSTGICKKENIKIGINRMTRV